MAILFLLNKNSLGGKYSVVIGVRYSIDIALASGSPLENCRGVTDGMGLPISEGIFFALSLVLDLFSVRNSGSPTCFAYISIVTSVFLSGLSAPGDISSWLGPLDSYLRELFFFVFP
jgi:hypothetical protein